MNYKQFLELREQWLRLELELAMLKGNKSLVAELAKDLSEVVRAIKLNS